MIVIWVIDNPYTFRKPPNKTEISLFQILFASVEQPYIALTSSAVSAINRYNFTFGTRYKFGFSKREKRKYLVVNLWYVESVSNVCQWHENSQNSLISLLFFYQNWLIQSYVFIRNQIGSIIKLLDGNGTDFTTETKNHEFAKSLRNSIIKKLDQSINWKPISE